MTTQQQGETVHPSRCEHNLELHKGLVLDKEKRGFKYIVGAILIIFAIPVIPLTLFFTKDRPIGVTEIITPSGLGIFFLLLMPSFRRVVNSAKPDKSEIPIPSPQKNIALKLYTSKVAILYIIPALIVFVAAFVPFIIVDSGLNHLDHMSFITALIRLKRNRALIPSVAIIVLFALTFYIPLRAEATHIDLDSYGLRIYTKGMFTSLLTKKKILCDQPWENLIKVYIKPRFTCYYQLHDEQHHTFEIPITIFADPCWLNYITTTCINLPNTQQRHQFLTHLRDYAPTQGKIVTK